MAAVAEQVTHEQLHETLEHARLVQDLGGAGAPGAAYAIAEIAPLLVLELRDARAAARRFYRADGTYEEAEPAVIILRRVHAAQQLDSYRATQEACDAELARLKVRVADLERQLESALLSADSEHRLAARLLAERDAAGAIGRPA